ncbi:FTR1 family protein [Microbulbifer sp. SA54]|uniref:FTR1 family protein n=1 Tax=Microbulbifer sp. SA54 TaxID=3401577 RepID=UPI003AAF92E8
MLLTSVIIVLREVLEAALLLSILLAMCRILELRRSWFYGALACGVLGSVVYGLLLGPISEAADGVGQELLNAALQIALYGFLLVIALLLIITARGSRRHLGLLQYAMLVSIALATLREGSEIFIYLMAFVPQQGLLPGVLSGALIGAGIGFSIGALFYYLLVELPRRYTLGVVLVLLTLVGSGLCLQAAQQLIQADWLPSSAPVWDTSNLIGEDSLVGQLLYALLGYEATPTAAEVTAYSLAAIPMIALSVMALYLSRKERPDYVLHTE